MAHFYGAEYKFQSKSNYSTESFHTVRIQPKILLFFYFLSTIQFSCNFEGKKCASNLKSGHFGLPHYLNQRSHDSFCVVNALANRIVIEWIISIELNDFGGQKRTIGKSTFVSFELKLPNGQKLEKSTPKKLNDEN